MSRTPKVLVVDDEPPLRELVVVTLGDAFDCVEADDGDQALERLRDERFDLVLLDVMMPGRSGLEVLQEMRGDEELRDVPVLVMSAWQSEEDIDRVVAAGADGFLPKPFAVEELASLARRLVA